MFTLTVTLPLKREVIQISVHYNSSPLFMNILVPPFKIILIKKSHLSLSIYQINQINTKQATNVISLFLVSHVERGNLGGVKVSVLTLSVLRVSSLVGSN